MIRLVYYIVILLLGTCPLLSQDSEWRFRKQEGGIKAYTRDVEGSSFDEYRLTMVVDADIEDVVSVIRDHDRFEDIYSNVKDVRNILDEPDIFINYARVDTPFPAKDREAVYINHISRLGSRIVIDVSCTTDHYVPQSRMVQITHCSGQWTLASRPDGSVIVQQTMLLDPGGSVPGWIANKYVVNEPIYTFKKIKSYAEHNQK